MRAGRPVAKTIDDYLKPLGAEQRAAYRGELAAYDISKGTIRFPADRPLPATLVRKLVKARIAEREG
jgi:uncharacterized protein YdhG (YjbR/CyaY superfamily)